MAEAAEYGLMLCDGKSKGTVNNVVNLSRDHKPVVVNVAPTKQFERSGPLPISSIFSHREIRTACSESSASCT